MPTDARLAVIMTVRNRRAKTVSALQSLFQACPPNWTVTVDVVDDGSTDGTRDLVSDSFPSVSVIAGDGSLYWAGGMASAEEAASHRAWDVLLWLNDDVDLYPGSLEPLIVTARQTDGITVGAMEDGRGMTSYSGLRRVGPSPTMLRLAPPDQKRVTQVDTFHGNLVAISRSAWEATGRIDAEYRHAYADNDYGLRARNAHVPVLLMPRHAGRCDRNLPAGTWADRNAPRATRLKALLGRKGLPLMSQVRYVRRFGGALWPLWLALSYARPLLMVVFGRGRAEM